MPAVEDRAVLNAYHAILKELEPLDLEQSFTVTTNLQAHLVAAAAPSPAEALEWADVLAADVKACIETNWPEDKRAPSSTPPPADHGSVTAPPVGRRLINGLMTLFVRPIGKSKRFYPGE